MQAGHFVIVSICDARRACQASVLDFRDIERPPLSGNVMAALSSHCPPMNLSMQFTYRHPEEARKYSLPALIFGTLPDDDI